jgi:hypothetical protein
MDQGMPQADAMMEVTKKYSAELKEAMDWFWRRWPMPIVVHSIWL